MIELASGEIADGETHSSSELAFHQEGGSQIADVVDRRLKEGVTGPATLRGDAHQVPPRGPIPSDESLLLEEIERPIGEGARERPGPTDLAVGGEGSNQMPAVDSRLVLGDQGEAGRLGEGLGLHERIVGEIVKY